MKITSINIRGLGNTINWKYIKDLIVKEDTRMICIQEIKLK